MKKKFKKFDFPVDKILGENDYSEFQDKISYALERHKKNKVSMIEK